MYNVNKQNILNYKSKIYIANRTGVIQDENLNQIETFDTPQKYIFHVENVNEDSEIREFGEFANSMKVASITEKTKYMNKFREFDKVYIDTLPTNEIENGYNADYRIYSIRPQNTCIRIYFKKITK